ncbi:hypothetical protein [Mesonia sp. K4-1]|uniref:hypothetical protein n=1 Tax=Mesonia sp. K4-1 TaxID=2602760 RepID=UPI0011CC8507|nr:hypothetical protein [Mesonia sp. K4-1]TXK78902.1 hypothetical protein FT986_03640 [Mesonia sp. K4-1]
MFFKVKAGALQLTIYIVVVIAILLSVFLILVHTQNYFKLTHEQLLNATKLNDKAIYHSLLYHPIPLGDSINLQIFEKENIEVSVKRTYWGIFSKIEATSTFKSSSIKKISLTGAKQELNSRPALYLADFNRPLVVVGNTYIKGAAYVPTQGVRAGNINGKSFYSSQLIEGPVYSYPRKLPQVSNELQQQIKFIPEKFKELSDSHFLPNTIVDSISNSFHSPVQILYEKKAINLEHCRLTGNLIIQSDNKITVTLTAKLTDVILIAPEIEIKDNVKGTFQAFATEKISVGKNVTLQYPSALVMNKKEEKKALDSTKNIIHNNSKSRFKIDKGSAIEGIVLDLGEYNPQSYNSDILIEENTEILGELYATGNIELKGRVKGTVYANNFLTREKGSIYQNHLFNVTIDVSKLPEEYVGLDIENKDKGIVKWLY